MPTNTPRTPAHAMCTRSISQIMPGVLVAGMFLLTSVAFSSLSDREVLLLKLNASSREPGVVTIEAPTIVRSSLQTTAQSVARPVLPRETAVRNGLRMLSAQSSDGPLERVTLRIDAGYGPADSYSRIENLRELLQVVSRRQESLELRITLRVAPSNLPDALNMVTDLSKDGAASAPDIVVSVDSGLDEGSFFVDVFRASHTANMEVVTR